MRIRMLITVTCHSPEARYAAGKSYEVPDAVGQQWERLGYCERDKMISAVPETKAAAADPALPRREWPPTKKTLARKLKRT